MGDIVVRMAYLALRLQAARRRFPKGWYESIPNFATIPRKSHSPASEMTVSGRPNFSYETGFTTAGCVASPAQTSVTAANSRNVVTYSSSLETVTQMGAWSDEVRSFTTSADLTTQSPAWRESTAT